MNLYYKLDAKGWPLESWKRPQPDEDLQHLPEQPSDHHRWDGEQWVEDADRVLLDERSEALRRINTGCDGELAGIRNQYPAAELETWPAQRDEARAYDVARQAGETLPATPMLDGIADARGITTDNQVDRVLAAVEQYTTAAAAAVGKRQRLEADIEAAYQAGDRATLEAIDW